MPENENENALIAEYEWLRQLAKVLDGQSNYVDTRLVEIERQLPDAYAFADDETARRRLEESSVCGTSEGDSPIFVGRKSGQSPANDDPDERYVLDERR